MSVEAYPAAGGRHQAGHYTNTEEVFLNGWGARPIDRVAVFADRII